MKIQLEKYNPGWKQTFEILKQELADLIGFVNPKIEHIGSTSIEGLSAKPIIDLLIGLNEAGDLEKVVEPLTNKGYMYYEIYNTSMPYRRFFVKHKASAGNLYLPGTIKTDEEIPRSTGEHNQRLAHLHILTFNSEHWTRHIAFRDYLRKHTDIKHAYQELKKKLSASEWTDGNDYNKAKDTFIKQEERNAVNWYLEKLY